MGRGVRVSTAIRTTFLAATYLRALLIHNVTAGPDLTYFEDAPESS